MWQRSEVGIEVGTEYESNILSYVNEYGNKKIYIHIAHNLTVGVGQDMCSYLCLVLRPHPLIQSCTQHATLILV